eukprot:403356065
MKFLDGYKYLLPRYSQTIAPFVFFACQKYVNIPSSTSSHISGMTAFKKHRQTNDHSELTDNKSFLNQSIQNLQTELSFNFDNTMSVHGYLNQPNNNNLTLNQYSINNASPRALQQIDKHSKLNEIQEVVNSTNYKNQASQNQAKLMSSTQITPLKLNQNHQVKSTNLFDDTLSNRTSFLSQERANQELRQPFSQQDQRTKSQTALIVAPAKQLITNQKIKEAQKKNKKLQLQLHKPFVVIYAQLISTVISQFYQQNSHKYAWKKQPQGNEQPVDQSQGNQDDEYERLKFNKKYVKNFYKLTNEKFVDQGQRFRDSGMEVSLSEWLRSET